MYTSKALSRPRRKFSRKGWYYSLLCYTSMKIAVTGWISKLPIAISQQIGCSCTPLEYRWILNFTNPCPTATIAPNPGIEAPFCLIDVDTAANGIVDSIPVEVTSYFLLELDNGHITQNKNASLTDGDVIEFVSATKTKPSYVSQSFLAEIIGRNAADEKIELSLLAKFTNVCEQPPFQLGDSIGWITYGAHVPYRSDTCFLPSHNPSSTPSYPPSDIRLTNIPSATPSILVSFTSPTRAPNHQSGPTVKTKSSKKSKISPKKSKKEKKSKSYKQKKQYSKKAKF